MIYKTLYRKLKIESQYARGEPRCSGRVGSSCPTSGTRRVILVSNPVPIFFTIHEWGNDCDYDNRNISVVICDTVNNLL